MAELVNCRLCGTTPTAIATDDCCCMDQACPLSMRPMSSEQWTKLMGQGEAHILGPSLLEQSDLDFIAARLGRVARRVGYPMPDGDAQFIVSVSGSILGGIDHAIQLLQQEAPAVDDGVVRRIAALWEESWFCQDDKNCIEFEKLMNQLCESMKEQQDAKTDN